MREVVLDTETTGLSARDGDRLVEIGCIELENHLPTGRVYHQYINPTIPMPPDAQKIHGLSDEFLKDKPVFSNIAEAFLDFISDAKLIIHNAKFDISFINAELERGGLSTISIDRTVDTIAVTRKKYPGAPASLDALCRRFNIDNSARTLHGALLDAELLSEVYLELIGGRQPGLVLETSEDSDEGFEVVKRERLLPRPHQPTEEELEKHNRFIQKLLNPLWKIN
ncbi:MAG: DNA polymerase III subunit epsilon [Rhodospirillales bacterium]|nr:DNA polymerase III subunit epsilon [Rhodospirillales bacterium]|tara:strand:+ start:7831 stop:8505 length:675 start_codon:yes stop_codon:yes gene_type:complete